MFIRHVLGFCRVGECVRVENMAGEYLPVIKYFYHHPAVTYDYTLCNHFKGHTVKMVFVTYMIVFSDQNIMLDINDPERLCRQLLCVWFIKPFEAFPTRLMAIIFHRPVVELFKQFDNRFINFYKRKKLPVTQSG